MLDEIGVIRLGALEERPDSYIRFCLGNGGALAEPEIAHRLTPREASITSNLRL